MSFFFFSPEKTGAFAPSRKVQWLGRMSVMYVGDRLKSWSVWDKMWTCVSLNASKGSQHSAITICNGKVSLLLIRNSIRNLVKLLSRNCCICSHEKILMLRNQNFFFFFPWWKHSLVSKFPTIFIQQSHKIQVSCEQSLQKACEILGQDRCLMRFQDTRNLARSDSKI